MCHPVKKEVIFSIKCKLETSSFQEEFYCGVSRFPPRKTVWRCLKPQADHHLFQTCQFSKSKQRRRISITVYTESAVIGIIHPLLLHIFGLSLLSLFCPYFWGARLSNLFLGFSYIPAHTKCHYMALN